MANLPNKDKFLRNFARCKNWEEKYLYIIELGNCLPPFPVGFRNSVYRVSGCQSQVWILMTKDDKGSFHFYGDSDAAIVKGLIAVVFIFYQGLTPAEIISYDIWSFFDALALTRHLTLSRSHGLGAMVRGIRAKATMHA